MIHTLQGTLTAVKENFAVVEAGGLGFKVHCSPATRSQLPPPGSRVKLFCFLYVRENALDLYGFLSEDELKLFELLNSISGVGPKLSLERGPREAARVGRLKAGSALPRGVVVDLGVGKRIA